MNDNDIIKALELCISGEKCNDKCPYYKYSYEVHCVEQNGHDLLDLINRQKAEIERLTVNTNAFGLGMRREKERADTARAEAIKEFAERLKNNIDLYRYVEEYYVNAEICYEIRQDLFNDKIDSLVKEMTEGEDGNV